VRIEFWLPRPIHARDLNIFVRALTAYNVRWLRAHPETPSLRASGVRYVRQNVGWERFLPIPYILAAGGGDCDQLCCWRAAEIRVRQGIAAVPEVIQINERLFHVFVRFPNGRAEDISAHLGMRVPQRMAAAGRAKLAKWWKQRKRSQRNAGVSNHAVAAVSRRFVQEAGWWSDWW
jgi:hypothetical protein